MLWYVIEHLGEQGRWDLGTAAGCWPSGLESVASRDIHAVVRGSVEHLLCVGHRGKTLHGSPH